MEWELTELIAALNKLKEASDKLGAKFVNVYTGHADGTGLNYMPDQYSDTDKRLIAEGMILEGDSLVNVRIGSIFYKTPDDAADYKLTCEIAEGVEK